MTDQPFTKNISEKQKFSVVKRMKSVTYALRGIRFFIATQHNAWLHVATAIIVIILAAYFRVSIAEWVTLIGSMFFVLVTEAVNTAIEIDIDLTSPDYHPFARDTKDVAAGAVLLSAICAFTIYAIVFIPRIIYLLL